VGCGGCEGKRGERKNEQESYEGNGVASLTQRGSYFFEAYIRKESGTSESPEAKDTSIPKAHDDERKTRLFL